MIEKLKLINFNYLPIILIILLPPALVSGPAIPDIFISVIGLIFLIISFQNRHFNFYFNPISIIFFIFFVIILISSALSEMPFTSLIDREAIFYFRFYIFSLAICYFVQINQKIILYLAISLLLTIIVITIDGSVEYFRGVSLFGIEAGGTRLFSLFIDEPIVGRYISAATMLCVSLLIFKYGYENNKMIFFIFTILAIGEVFTFMSGERSALAMIAVFSISGLILISKRRIERLFFIAISLILIIFLINIQDRSQDRFIQTVDEIQEREFQFVISSPVHEQHYQSALLMFKDNPYFGIGSNLYRHICKNEIYITGTQSCTTHPHHFYFQILSENGLIGFSVFMIFVLSLIFYLSRHFIGLIIGKKGFLISDRIILFYIFLLVMIFPFWPHGNFYHNWTNIPLFIGLGFFLTNFISIKNKKNEI